MSLKNKTVKGVLWTFSTRITARAVSLTATIVLARLLTTDEFGLLATALIFIAFAEIVGELGMTTAVIQKKDLDDVDLDSAFYFSIFLSLSTYAAFFFTAPAAGAFFDAPGLSPVIQVASISVFFTGIRAVPLGLLTKQMLFNKRAKAELVSIVAGGVTTIALAYIGLGLWSLVWGRIVQSVLGAAIVFHLCPWRPKFRFNVSRLKTILNFGLPNFGSQTLYFFSERSAPFIIAKALGANVLGYYSIAANTSYYPTAQMVNTIYQVSFPMFCKLEEDGGNLGSAFSKVSLFVALLVMPALAGLFIVADYFIVVVLTSKWLPSLTVLRIFCVVTIIASMSAAIPHVMLARHKQYVMLRYDTVCAIAFPACFLFAVNFGIEGVAVAYLTARLTMVAFLYRLGLSEMGLEFKTYVRMLEPALSATAFMALAVIAVRFGVTAGFDIGTTAKLFISCAAGAVAYSGFLVVFRPGLVREMRGIVRGLRT